MSEPTPEEIAEYKRELETPPAPKPELSEYEKELLSFVNRIMTVEQMRRFGTRN